MKIPRIVKYGGTNLAAFIFDFTLLLILDFILDIERALIAFFCYISGTLVSYVLAKNFVFPKGWLDSKPTVEFSAYFFGGVMGAVITALIFAILESFNISNILIQKIITTPFAFIIVFLYRNYFVFKK